MNSNSSDLDVPLDGSPSTCAVQLNKKTDEIQELHVDSKIFSVSAVSHNEILVDRASADWKLGDWQSLAKINHADFLHHPDRAKIALLAAAGRLQIDVENISEARQFVRLAQNWGGDNKFIRQILIAGVYNSLGRIAALDCQLERAMQHFNNALIVDSFDPERRFLLQERVNKQLHQLGLPLLPIVLFQPQQAIKRQLSFSLKTLAVHNLGDAWAGNTINTVIFRHHGILTRGQVQYTAFYVDNHALRVVKRDLTSDTLQTYDIPGEYNLRDAHNSISLGFDRLGYLHISYDHHTSQLRYRRSRNPGDINSWTEELPMTGVYEDKVTYPTFILPHHEFPLTFLYRDGVHDKGSARIKTYDEITQTWSNHQQAILSGSEQRPWTSNPYWNHPAVGTDGSLHLSFVWRTHTLGEEQRINNVNIDYACSYDNGVTWQTSHKRPYKLPITQVNAETIYPVSPGSNLINQSSMALDSHNYPHIVFYSDDLEGVPQYQHLWFNGKEWRHQIISKRTQAFTLQGGGTLKIPISRPEIVIDRSDNAYVITRGEHTGNRMVVTYLRSPDYFYVPEDTQLLCDEDLGFSEPIIDRSRWQSSNILTLFLQKNQQPNNDLRHQSVKSLVKIFDFEFGLNNE